MQQANLPFEASPDYSRESFLVSDCNREALTWIDAWPDWSVGNLYLYGPAGSGKTHLAHLWARSTQAVFLDQAKLGAESSAQLTAKGSAFILDGLKAGYDETGLFHLLNHLRETKAPLLITATLPPLQQGIALPDLASRLQAMPIAALSSPDDALASAMLVKLFHDRQLRVAPEVIDYILPRIERSFDAIQKLVNLLDQEALRQHKNITVPFVRSLMESLWR